MAELWFGHFDSTPEDKRRLLAADWARFIASCVTNGIRNGGTNLQVSSEGTGMTVRVDEGSACILGYMVEIRSDHSGRWRTVDVPEAHPHLPRIDRLVLRLDRRIQSRNIRPVILMGTAAASPTPPNLTRTNDVWDLSLAQIRVNANTLFITDANITDERFDTELCGLMNSVLGLDPSAWQAQFDAFMAKVNISSEELKKQMRNEFDLFAQSLANEGEDLLEKISNDASTLHGRWQNWFDSIKVELHKYGSFNFDNQIIMPGTYKTFDDITSGQIREQIHFSHNDSLIADMLTKFISDGSIEQILTIYNSDGTVFSSVKQITTFPDGKPRVDVINYVG